MSFKSKVYLKTPKGRLLIRAFCKPETVKTLTLGGEFGAHAQFKSLYTRRESLETIAAHQGANLVLAVDGKRRIVGFGVLDFPDPEERWAQLGKGLMIEIKAVEVSRSWRGMGVAGKIMEMLLRHPKLEEMIVYLVGYSWTWDLEGTTTTAQAYRQLLIHLYSRYGFVELPTNEPNICLKPENIFMGRIGDKITPEVQKQFKWLRFGMTP